MYQYISKEGLRDPLFYFTTKYGLEYFICFRRIDIGNFYFQNLYSVDFWEINNQKFHKDKSVENTIRKIILDFFDNNPAIILHYVCDTMDFKQDFRKKLFDIWYKSFENNEFSKLNYNYQILEENINYHLGFIFKNDFYELTEMAQKVNLQLNEFTNFK